MMKPTNREEQREFFRRKNAQRRLIRDPEMRRTNREMGQLLSIGLYRPPKQASDRAESTADSATRNTRSGGSSTHDPRRFALKQQRKEAV